MEEKVLQILSVSGRPHSRSRRQGRYLEREGIMNGMQNDYLGRLAGVLATVPRNTVDEVVKILKGMKHNHH